MLNSLEHDDLNRARKALFVTSVTTLIIGNACISDGPIKISEFEVVLSKYSLLFWLKAAVLYFTYIFVIRLFADNSLKLLQRVKVNFEKEVSNLAGSNADPNQIIRDKLREIEANIESRQTFFFLLTDVAPVVLLSAIALSGLFGNLFPGACVGSN